MRQQKTEKVRVREGSREDRQRLKELWAGCWKSAYSPLVGAAGVDGMLRELDESDCRDMLPGTDERILVATQGDQAVGSAIFAERRRTAYLWGMYVHPDWQRQGVGTAMLTSVSARLLPTTRIEVHVLASSSGAQAFYRGFGFAEVGPCISHLGADDLGRPGVVMSVSTAMLHPT